MRALLVLLLLASCAQLPAATSKLLSATTWTYDDSLFGGFSGLELSEDGMSFTALSDRGGLFVTGTFTRSGGQITAISAPLINRIRRPNGDHRAQWTDSEGLAIGVDGTMFISTEAPQHRLFRADGQDIVIAIPLPQHPDFPKLQGNSSLEALAIGPDGALYTIPERSGRATRPFPVYRFLNGVWDIPFDIPRRGTHLVVGADIGPDNRLYVLERNFTGIGFQSRVRRFNMDGSGEETLIDTANGTHDNLEGISVWRDATGALRITMISDDNFRFFQKTEIVEYQISD